MNPMLNNHFVRDHAATTVCLLITLLFAYASMTACMPRQVGATKTPEDSSQLEHSTHRSPHNECFGSGCGPRPAKRSPK
jgi:hypothetical protein